MDERTAEALEASIKHWEENRAVDSPEQASMESDDCSLCTLFLDILCRGCPIMERTGCKSCSMTPYEIAAFALAKWEGDPNNPDRKQAWQKACDAEIAFLKSVRKDAQ